MMMWAQGQSGCTVTVQSGQFIQKAIDEAPEGVVICLAAGTWQENLKIEKSLTLRGVGQEQTRIKGKEKWQPVIQIKSDFEIAVAIEGLTVAGGKLAPGIEIEGKAKVTITDSQLSDNEFGIRIWGSATVIISNSRISGNSFDGIRIGGSAQATVSSSQISGNSRDGISMDDSAHLIISNSQISGNRNGIWMEMSAQAIIEKNTIQENKWCGIRSSSNKPAQGRGNRMENNGVDLGGNVPASLRIPLVEETTQTQLSFPGPYLTLQETIDALAPGGTITIAAGEHRGGVTIWKPLRLKGVGQEQVKIVGAVSLISEAQGVQIEGVTITGSSYAGLLLGGQAKATISNSRISGNSSDGIWMVSSAQAIITDSQISENGSGIWIEFAQVIITNSQVSGNSSDGIWMVSSAQATITNSRISGNRGSGIEMCSHVQAIISNSQILGNHSGIRLLTSAQGIITNSQISGNELCGCGICSAQAEIRDSTIAGNGEACKGERKGFLCNGISVRGNSQVRIVHSKIIKNADWGVAACMKQCGEEVDRFTGNVIFEDMTLEDISGNNTAGNQNGMGNPGNHPWNHPDAPDGQVCLPYNTSLSYDT